MPVKEAPFCDLSKWKEGETARGVTGTTNKTSQDAFK